MSLEANDIELIEGHLDGTLTQAEAQEFESKLASSEAFREYLTFQRNLLGHLEAEQKSTLKGELGDMLQSSKKSSGTSFKVIWLAASILLTGGFAALWVGLQGPSHSQQLFDQYFDPYPVLSVVRGDAPNGLSPLRVYAEGNYQQFVEIMKSSRMSDIREKSNELLLAYGNALLALSEPEAALEPLQQILKGEKYYPDAQWYQSLTYLKLGEPEKAQKLLMQLITTNSFYQSSARKLLEELKK